MIGYEKKILFILLILIPFMVNAKGKLVYDWSLKEEGLSLFFEERNNKLIFYNEQRMNGGSLYNYSMDGKNKIKLSQDSFDEYDLLKIELISVPYVQLIEGKDIDTFIDFDQMTILKINKSKFSPNEFDKSIESSKAFSEYTDSELKEELKEGYILYDEIKDIKDVYVESVKVQSGIKYISYVDKDNNRIIKVFDKDNKEIINNKESNTNITPRLFNIIVRKDTFLIESNKDKNVLLIYDFSGNIIGKIDLKEMMPKKDFCSECSLWQAKDINNGMIILLVDGLPIATSFRESNQISTSSAYDFLNSMNSNQFAKQIIDSPMYTSYLMKLSYEYEIETKTNGKGIIETVQSSKPDENITFRVIPNKGYVLGEVKVIDFNGNVLTFKSNTFTMPSSDVTIEAVFVKDIENPKTGSFIGILVIINIMAFILIKRYNKKVYKI